MKITDNLFLKRQKPTPQKEKTYFSKTNNQTLKKRKLSPQNKKTYFSKPDNQDLKKREPTFQNQSAALIIRSYKPQQFFIRKVTLPCPAEKAESQNPVRTVIQPAQNRKSYFLRNNKVTFSSIRK